MKRAAFALALGAVALAGACKKKDDAAPAASGSGSGSGSAVTAVVADASVDAPVEPAAAPAWELTSAPVELPCGTTPAPEGDAKAALAAGRAAGKAGKWADAVMAFEHVLKERADDAAALSELSVALLNVGDAARSLEVAERTISLADAPNAKAAAHYNAGRAAEALGKLDAARTHYEASLALRPNAAVQDRLAKVAAPAARKLGTQPTLTVCQALASPEDVCACLSKLDALPAAELATAGKGACELVDKQTAHARLAYVSEGGDASSSAVVLVAKLGDAWSAVRVVDTAPGVDLEEMPRASHGVEVVALEERTVADGVLVWVQTFDQFSETSMGEQEARGDASLSVCRVGAKAASCTASISLGAWDATYAPAQEEGEADRCDVRALGAYRATLSSTGVLTLVLDAGVDTARRAGRYEL